MFSELLRGLEKKGLLRSLVTRASAQGPRIRIGRRTYINFGSNDYLGLASCRELREAVCRSAHEKGVGSGASRLLAGGGAAHRDLERSIARFKGSEAALVFNSGYSANTGILPSVAPAGTVIFSDELNHASIIDGCRLSRAETVLYRHADAGHLGELLKKYRRVRKLVVTDTVFSMDGDVAPLPEIVSLCRSHGAMLYIDDAHGTGVLGNGRGALAHFRIPAADDIIQIGTFSKAFGSFGAFAAGGRDIIAWIANTARSFLFSTALPECLAAASSAAIGIVRSEPSLVTRLWRNQKALTGMLESSGFGLSVSRTPIIPLRAESVEDAVAFSAFLLRKGIYAPAIRPPTVRQPRVRITVCAGHAEKDLKKLVDSAEEWRREKG